MCAKHGIRCNAICPGSDPGDHWDRRRAQQAGFEQMQLTVWTVPDAGEPDDIPALALFLASDAARFINGAIVTADGGWLAA